MVLVAIAAGISWLYRSVNSYGFVALLVYATIVIGYAFVVYRWLKGNRRRAWRVFVGSGVAEVILFGVLGVTFLGMYWEIIRILLGMILLSIPLGAGIAWVKQPISDAPASHRSRFLAWVLVFGMVGLPTSMVFQNWPMRLAFLVSRPAFDRLADRIEAGESPRWPVYAGLFQVSGIARGHSGTPNTALTIGANPNGNTWFVRSSTPTSSLTVPPQVFVSEKLTADGRWWHQEED